MQRLYTYLCCVVLLLGSLLIANAQGSIYITVNTKSPNNVVDAEIKDAPIEAVLTELFYRTGGKYHVLIGEGVTGTINELSIWQEPFEVALIEILHKAETPATFTKVGADLYKVKTESVVSTLVPVTGTPVTPKETKPTTGTNNVPTIPVIKITMKIPPKTTTDATAATSTESIPGLVQQGTYGQTTAEPATKDYYVALIQIDNWPVSQLSQQFGFDYIASFSKMYSNNYGYAYNPYYNYNNYNPYGNGYGYNDVYYNTGYNNGYLNNGYTYYNPNYYINNRNRRTLNTRFPYNTNAYNPYPYTIYPYSTYPN